MQNIAGSQFVLPFPGFLLHRYTAVFIAVVHVYLSFGHLLKVFGGDVEWTHVWKGFGRSSAQHLLEFYSREFEGLKSFVGVEL